MKLQTKAQLSKVTLSLLSSVAFAFLLGIIVLVLCVGLRINPFKETTTGFLMASFLGLIGVGAILFLLNVATNISLIADTKVAELKIESNAPVIKRWAVVFLASCVALAGLIFAGTYISKENFIRVVRAQADEVLKENETLLEKVSVLLNSSTCDGYKKIDDIRRFLQHQRHGLPNLTLIRSGQFEDKMVFHEINSGPYDCVTYKPPYFECTKDVDCSYLKVFFSGGNVDVFQNYSLRDDHFRIYIPYVGKSGRFILLFERRNSYGKMGS